MSSVANIVNAYLRNSVVPVGPRDVVPAQRDVVPLNTSQANPACTVDISDKARELARGESK